MKKLSIKLLSATLLISALTGCLKDEGFDNQEYGIQIKDVRGVTLPEAPNSPLAKDLNALTTVQTIKTTVHLESDKPASQDIRVQLELAPALATAAGFTPLPTASFTMPLTITIPAGQMLADVIITVPNASVLNPTIKYGVGIRIISVDGGLTVAQNQKELVIGISIKNKYDGVYRVTGTFVDLTNATFTSVLPNTVHLITSGPNSVVVNRLINGAYIPGYLFSAAGSGTYYGSFGASFTFDAADNLVNVSNSYGQPSPNNRWAFIDPTGVNKYFPADRSIKAKYTLNQPTASTIRARFDETYTYVGPR